MTFHFMESASRYRTTICYTDPNKTNPKETNPNKNGNKTIFFLATCKLSKDIRYPPCSFFKYSESK